MAITKVFVVDDSYTFRTLLKKQLNTQDYKIVAEAQNGKEALEIYPTIEADVVIVDLKMPIMDGFELIPKLIQINPNQKILAVTTSGSNSELEEVRLLGALDALRKPFQPGFLLSRLERLMEISVTEENPLDKAVNINDADTVTSDNKGKPISDIIEEGNGFFDTQESSHEKNLSSNSHKEFRIEQPQLIRKIVVPVDTNNWDEEISDFIIEIPSSNDDNYDILTVENESDAIVFEAEFEEEMQEENKKTLATLLEGDDNSSDIVVPLDEKSDNASIFEEEHYEEIEKRKSLKLEISKPIVRLSYSDRSNLTASEDNDEFPDLSIFLNDTVLTHTTQKVGKKSAMNKLKNLFKIKGGNKQ